MPYITILYYTVTDLINFLCLREMVSISSILMNWPSERGLHSSKGITGNDCSQPYNVGRKSCRGGPSTFANFFPNLVNFPPLIPILFLPSFSSFLPALGTPPYPNLRQLSSLVGVSIPGLSLSRVCHPPPLPACLKGDASTLSRYVSSLPISFLA